MVEQYKTLLEECQGELVEKKSRFIATLRPVETEEEASLFIEEVKKKYWDARHNVFAYRIGTERILERCSDDGEPSGTAGMPTLEVLRGNKLTNITVVVTRYFGGTLLGTGGLVRAYGGSTKEAVNNAAIIEKVLYYLVHVNVDYGLTGKVQYEILKDEHNIYHTEYLENVQFQVLIEYSKMDCFSKKMIELTNNMVHIENMGLYYGMKLNDKIEINKV